MNPNIQASFVSHALPNFQAAFLVLGSNREKVVLTQCVQYNISRLVSEAFLQCKLNIAAQGALNIVDGLGRRIPLAFNLLMQVPSATGGVLMQALANLLTDIEIASAADADKRLARFKAAREIRAEKLRQIKIATKVAIGKAARRKALAAQLEVLEAQKPKTEAHKHFASDLVSWEKQAAELDMAKVQAKAEGNAELVKSIRKEWNKCRGNPPQSYETAFDRWRIKWSPIAEQFEQLNGAEEELDRLSSELAELLAAEAREREPVAPNLLYRNTPMPSVLKTINSAWPVGTAIYDAGSLPRMLCKHSAASTGACDASVLSRYAPGRVQLGIVGTATRGEVEREVKMLGQSATALALLHVVADSTQAALSLTCQSFDLDCLVEFDRNIVAAAVANVRAMMQDGFEPKAITLSQEAAAMVARERENLRACRIEKSLHPILDAYLARMPQSICQVAGLLYLGRNESEPVSAEVMQTAIATCRSLSDEFERAIVPAPEMPESERLAWMLRYALYGHVDKQMQVGAAQPFRIALSTLCNKAGSIGLSRAQVRRAAFAMRDLGWVCIVPDGLDQVVEMDQHLFDRMHRQ